MKTSRLLLSVALLLPTQLARAESLSEHDRAFFENRIRPALVKHCYQCHSAKAKELGGKLLLDSRAGVRTGGESGPAIVPGDPDASPLIQSVRYDGLEMPPENPLPAAVINDFVKWVRIGAPDPRFGQEAAKTESAIDPSSLWSFQPRTTPDVPSVQDDSWPRDPLDHYTLARIESAGLTTATDADARTLARRLYVDLHGLLPTFAQAEAFAAAYERDGQQAVERLVDSLLSERSFGERWGRHWLDVARYGESNGNDGLGRNATFPHAWRYRDYVIDALNRDVPYDRFLTEQIAGDLLPAENADQRNRQLIATGFLAIGSKPASAMNKNFAMDVVDDQIDVVGTAVLGLSVACARCHDHKHDPIPTRDYYALAGIFSSSETLYGLAANERLTAPATPLHELTSIWQPGSAKRQPGELKFPASYSASVDQLKPVLHAGLTTKPAGDELAIPASVKFAAGSFATVKTDSIRAQLPASSSSYAVSFWFKNQTKNTARPITAYLFSRAEFGNAALPGDHLGIGGSHDKARSGKLFVFNGNAAKKSIAGETVLAPGTWNHIVLVRDGKTVRVFLNGNSQPEIEGELPATFGENRDFCLGSRSDKFAPLVGNLAELALFDRAISESDALQLHAASGQPKGQRSLGLAMGVRDKAKPADTKIHIKGETGKLGPSVPRGFLTAYERAPEGRRWQSDVQVDGAQSGRLQLAAWLTQPDHPQTARVMANRIWLHLFGRGLVVTPDDFGVYGQRPTHPELLDHLANRFVRDGWSIKRLIRAVVLSRTYGLDSRCDAKLVQADPDNELFGRHNRRRLDAESLRDSILLASGRLAAEPGTGSAVAKLDRLINWPPGEATNLHQDSNHRSVYLCMLRNAPPPELAAFDLPNATRTIGQRNVTTQPGHGLFLLNNPFVVRQATAFATRLLEQSGGDDSGRVAEVFQRTLQRSPHDDEIRQSIEYLRAIDDTLRTALADDGSRQTQVWASFCQAMFTTNEFRYID